ncbi:hypothetical protein SAMN04487846_0002 [Microbacterium sp. cf046]|nr:hypothetical protein SAMN04487846_0002 [Microbacterium sp. cf046]
MFCHDVGHALRKKFSRRKFVSILLGLLFTLGLISDFGGAWQTVTHVVQWATAIYETGEVPRVSDIPSDLLPPHDRRPSFGVQR